MKAVKNGILGIMAAGLSGIFVLSILSFGLAEGLISVSPTRTIQPTLMPPNLTPIAVVQVTTTPFLTETFPPAPTQCPQPAGWQPYLVQPGDTLAGLARAHGITLELLMTENCLISSQIFADTLVYLPVLLTATMTQPILLTSTIHPTSSVTIACGPPPGWIRYTVKPGDTLTRISILYRVSVSQLKLANCLSSDYIHAGSQLWVPNVATSTFTTSPSLTPTLIKTTRVPTIPSTNTPTETLVPTYTFTPEPTSTETLEPTFTDTPEPTATETPQPTATWTPETTVP